MKALDYPLKFMTRPVEETERHLASSLNYVPVVSKCRWRRATPNKDGYDGHNDDAYELLVLLS